MTMKILAPVEISRQLGRALLSIRRGGTAVSDQQSLLSYRDEIAKGINPDPKNVMGWCGHSQQPSNLCRTTI
jgi:hypothetical protein